MSQLRVLVVGASIAGPSVAYWFARAGANVTIIERFPNLRTNGQAIDIRTAGVTVMRKIPGMEAAVRAKAVQIDGISFVGDNGRSYGVITPTGNPDQQSLVSEYEILRGDLAQVLFDLTKDNERIKYVFGEQVASMRQTTRKDEDGPITVEFTNGTPTSEYDLVVACDGATSRTRAMGLGCGIRDHVNPINCWAAYFSFKQDGLEAGRLGQAYSAPGGRFVAVGSEPSGMNRVALMGINRRDDREAMKSFREAMKQGDDALKRFVAQHFKGAGWRTDEFIGGIGKAEDFYANEIVQVKPPTLYKGHFVLVGDAGYAPGPTGSGTTLAIAGAYLLAGEVSKYNGDISAGLRGYEKQMRPIIHDLQKIPPLVPTVLAPQTSWGIWLRNNIFAFVAWSKIMEHTQKHFASAFASTDKFGLPEYEWAARGPKML